MLDERGLFQRWNDKEFMKNLGSDTTEEYRFWVKSLEGVTAQFKGMGDAYLEIVDAYRLIANDAKYNPTHRAEQFNQAVKDIQNLYMTRCNLALEKCEEALVTMRNKNMPNLTAPRTFTDAMEKTAYELERANNYKIWEIQLSHGTEGEIHSLFALNQQNIDFLIFAKHLLAKRRDLAGEATASILEAVERITSPSDIMLVDMDSVINSLKLCANANLYPDGLEQGYLTSGIAFRQVKNDLIGTAPIELKTMPGGDNNG